MNSLIKNTKTYSTDALSTCFQLFRILFNGSTIQTLMTIGLLFNLIQNSSASSSTVAYSNVTTIYSGALSSTSPRFIRPNRDIDFYYYHTVEVSVSAAGSYSFESNSSINTYGCLYNVTVDSLNFPQSLIKCDDDNGTNHQFRINFYFKFEETYILLVTTFSSDVTGKFSIIATGPASIELTYTTRFTFAPIRTTTTTSSGITSTYSGVLSSNSLAFSRPPATNGHYYYQAIQMTPSTGGRYIFTSSSLISMYGYFYSNSFMSVYPSSNLIASDGEILCHQQFRINVTLQSSSTYILVVTTQGSRVTGSFSINAVGPAYLYLYSITRTTTTTPRTIISTYSGALSSNGLTFSRPSGNQGVYYYQAIQVTPDTTGRYVFTSSSSIDTYGYLYDYSFDPYYPSRNLIAYNADGNGDRQFRINVTLQSWPKYILIVTTHRTQVTGSFSVKAVGPAYLTLTSFTPIITATTTPHTMTSTLWDTLSSNSLTFSRPSGNQGVYYYYAIKMTPDTTGRYVFTSNSSMDTYGYLYNDSFDPFYPSRNLIVYDDDSNGNRQFCINVTLKSRSKYILIVTTHGKQVIGSFIVKAVGPASLYLTAIDDIRNTNSYNLSRNCSRSAWPDGNTDCYYYAAIEISTYTVGVYAFITNSSFNTSAYLYSKSFNPSCTSRNLIAYNYGDNDQRHLRIMYNLQNAQTYILIVATYSKTVTGKVSITIVGPGWIHSYLPSNYPSKTDCDDHKLSTGAIVGITFGCVIFCMIICCAVIRRHVCKKASAQQPAISTYDQTLQTSLFPVNNIQSDPRRTSGVYGPYTIPVSRGHSTLEEVPPPSYASVMASFRVQ